MTMLDTIAQLEVCDACGIVDRDDDRTTVGHPCPTCKAPSEGGTWYFSVSIHALIDFMIEMESPLSSPGPSLPGARRAHEVAIPLFFCALGEAMLDKFLREMMLALQLPEAVTERILDDHQYARARVEKAFPAVTGTKWRDAVNSVGDAEGVDYLATVDFFAETASRRNVILHTGNVWAVNVEVARRCLEHTPRLVNLFASLHNAFVAPIYRQSGRRYLALKRHQMKVEDALS